MSPFWILLKPRMTDLVVTTGVIRHAKLQSNCHHKKNKNQHSGFYRPDALPVTQPTVLEHWREEITQINTDKKLS